MTTYEHQKIYQWEQIRKYSKKGIYNISKLAKKLCVSRNQTYALVKKFKTLSKDEFIEHNSKYKNSNNQKINSSPFVDKYIDLTEKINKFRKDDSYRLTFSDFYDYLILENKEKVPCLKTLNNMFRENLIYSPVAYRRTKRTINKKLKNLKKITKNVAQIINEVGLAKTPRPYKGKDYWFGQIVELDACQHRWFSGEKFHIYHAIDAQTGMLLAIHIEKEETTLGYYKLLRKLFVSYGKPTVIRTDKRRSFWSGETTQTLLEKTLVDLGIELEMSSSATSKANVERSFSNAQKLYPLFFYLHKIETLEEAEKIVEDLRKEYNKKYNKKPIKNTMFAPISKKDIDEKICLKKKLKITNGLFISYQGKYLAPIRNKKRMVMSEGKIIILNIELDTKKPFIIHENQKIYMEEVDASYEFEEQISKIEQRRLKVEKIIKQQKIKTQYINKMLDKKRLNISKNIEYLEELILKAKESGILKE